MTFAAQVHEKYQVEAKIHGLIDHPLSDRIKLIKKNKKQPGPTTVVAYDLKEGVWTELFHKFSAELAKRQIKLKPPLDKTPHVTLAYIINASQDELEKVKQASKTITPFTVEGVSFLKGKATKDIYVVLDLAVTQSYRAIFNFIEKLVGRDRVVDYRTVWKGHIPHASIGTIVDAGSAEKEMQKILSKLAKEERIVFTPSFVEIHTNTGRQGGFTPEMVDFEPI